MNNEWIKFTDERPAEMQRVLVKDATEKIYYAVYYEYDGFDVHRMDLKKPSSYRFAWARFTHRSFPYWKSLDI